LVSDFKAMKKDPTRRQTDVVLAMTVRPGISSKGNATVRIDWVTPHRQFSTWLMPDSTWTRGQAEWQYFETMTAGGTEKPDTVTYQKDAESGFYRVILLNQPADIQPPAKPDWKAEARAA
jgi:hypothetical protein